MNINQSISFLVFMLSIRLGGCDTNLKEAKYYILNKNLDNIFIKTASKPRIIAPNNEIKAIGS